MDENQYSIYEKDDHYDWHIDSHAKPYDDGLIRKLSFTLCLSESSPSITFDASSVSLVIQYGTLSTILKSVLYTLLSL